MKSTTIYELLRTLEANKLHFSLTRHRDDTILVMVTAVGVRVEIDVFEDGHIEYSLFHGNEEVESDMDRLYRILDIG